MSRYRHDIGPDIGKKTDIGPDICYIGFGNLRVCPDIDTISGPIYAIIAAISGLATYGYVPI
jgi:hypothetical protein